MSDGRTCRPAPGVVWTADAAQTLLVDRDAGLSWTLEGVEAAVWQWLAAGNSYERTLRLLGALLSLSREEAGRRLDAILQGWLDAGILEASRLG